jgi:hypothetical protein
MSAPRSAGGGRHFRDRAPVRISQNVADMATLLFCLAVFYALVVMYA